MRRSTGSFPHVKRRPDVRPSRRSASAGCAVAASLFYPLGAAIGRTVGIRHAVSWVRRALLDEKVFDASTFAKNRDRLLTHEIAQGFLGSLLALPEAKGLLSAEHFSVGGTLLKAWPEGELSSQEPVLGRRPEERLGEPPSPGRNGEANLRKTKRSNGTHASTTDKDTRLYRKGEGRRAVIAISFVDSLKPILCAGFILADVARSLYFDLEARFGVMAGLRPRLSGTVYAPHGAHAARSMARRARRVRRWCALRVA